MSKKLTAFALALAGMAVAASPAPAHPGHASCAGGAPGVVEEFNLPIGPGPGFGTGFVKPLATNGQAASTIATLHAAYCAPH